MVLLNLFLQDIHLLLGRIRHEDGDDEEYVPKRRSARSWPVKRPNAVGGKSEVDKSRKVVSEKFFTQGCPACQSGMNAQGIRHSARCKRRREVDHDLFSLGVENHIRDVCELKASVYLRQFTAWKGELLFDLVTTSVDVILDVFGNLCACGIY